MMRPYIDPSQTPEQQRLSQEIIALETAALNKWFQGDSSGYRELWSEKDFSYFDSLMEHRIDSYAHIADFVKGAVDGQLFADSYELISPRVQFSLDNSMGVLTFQLHAKTTLLTMHYNCVEVYRRDSDQWRVVHSTWAFIQPLTNDFGTLKRLV